MRKNFFRPEQAMEHDIAFHAAIAVASRNPLFALIVGSFGVVTRQTWRIGWDSRRPTPSVSPTSSATNAIAAAISARDRVAAEAAMAAHFDDSVKALLAAGVV